MGSQEKTRFVELQELGSVELLQLISLAFKNHFRTRGYKWQPGRPLINPDHTKPNEPFFVPDHTSYMKKSILTGTIPSRGEVTIQDCLRTQNLDIYEGRWPAELKFLSKFRMLSVVAGKENKGIFRDGWFFLTQGLGIPPENILIKVSESDPDLSDELFLAGIPPESISIMKEVDNPIQATEATPQYFQWAYGIASGMEAIYGRGVTFALMPLAHGGGYRDVGNLIAIRSGNDRKTLAYDYGFGLETLLKSIRGDPFTAGCTEIWSIIKPRILRTNSQTHEVDLHTLADCIISVVHIAQSGIIEKGKSRGKNIYNRYLAIAHQIGSRVGLSVRDLADIAGEYAAVYFGADETARKIRKQVKGFYRQRKIIMESDAELVAKNLIDELTGAADRQTIQEILEKYGQDELKDNFPFLGTVGKVLRVRCHGKVTFATVGHRGKNIQVMLKLSPRKGEGLEEEPYLKSIHQLKPGNIIDGEGRLILTKTKEITLFFTSPPRIFTSP